MADEPVGQTISWPLLKKHLDMLLVQSRGRLESATGLDEMHRIQGEVGALKKLQNLPETLALIDAEDRRVAGEKR